MSKAFPELMSTERLIKAGSLHSAGALPAENYQTYPIPVPGPCGLRAAFLYATAEVVVPLSGLQVRTPTYIGFVDAETARFEELRVFSAGEVGLAHVEGQHLGRCPGENDWETRDIFEKQASLYRGYDAVLGSFAAGLPSLPLETRRAAAEFGVVLAELLETPLLPFYRMVGRAFFTWLDRVAC